MKKAMKRHIPQGRNICKVVLLGAMSSGKSSLLCRLLKGEFNPDLPSSFGSVFVTKTMETNDGPLDLHIWDTMGEERFRSLVRMYYRDAKAAILCCDVTDSKSFQELEFWIKELQENEKECKIYICGTKLDLVHFGKKMRVVSTEDLKMFNGKCFETSSKSGENVHEMFHQVAKDLCSVYGVTLRSSGLRRGIELSEVSHFSNDTHQRKCCGNDSMS